MEQLTRMSSFRVISMSTNRDSLCLDDLPPNHRHLENATCLVGLLFHSDYLPAESMESNLFLLET